MAIVGNWENGLPNGDCKFIDPYYSVGSSSGEAEADGVALNGKWINEVHWMDTLEDGTDGYFPVVDDPGGYGLDHVKFTMPEVIYPIGDATEIVISNKY